MSGSKINDYAIGDQNIQSVMLTLDKAFKGFHQVSLTNYNTTSESAIAAGSVVEVNGALYKFDSDENITGSPSNGTVYIYLVPSGDTVTAAYTNTAPTWSDSKQGWYGTGGNANYRYLEFALTKASAVWSNKRRIYYFYNIDEITTTGFSTKSLNSYYMTNVSSGRLSLFDVDTSLPSNGSATYNFQVFKPCRLWLGLDSNRASASGTDTATAVLNNRYITYTGHNLASITVTTTAGYSRDQKHLIYDLGVGYSRLTITHTPGAGTNGSFRKIAYIISVANETNAPVLDDCISII